jgi:glyoxylase I family protein
MKFEHFALNVEDPIAVGAWYIENIGLTYVLENKESPFMRFLADDSGRVIMELYNNPLSPITDHSENHHLLFHVAFETENAEAEKERLMKVGASFVEEIKPSEGTHLVMLRDPWGMALQLCQRKIRFNK